MSCLSCTDVYSPRPAAPPHHEELILAHVPIDLIPSLKSVFGENLKTWVVTPAPEKKRLGQSTPLLDDACKARISRIFYRMINGSYQEARAFELNSVDQGIQLTLYHWKSISIPEFVLPPSRLGQIEACFFFSQAHLKRVSCLKNLNPHSNPQIPSSVAGLIGWDQNSRSLIQQIKLQESMFNNPVKRCIHKAQFTFAQEREVLAPNSTWSWDQYNPQAHLELYKRLQAAMEEQTRMPVDVWGIINQYLPNERIQ